MLDIFAFSQSFGRTPVSMELWNMMASDGASCFAVYIILYIFNCCVIYDIIA